jgi:ATPase subunit of ABC transporter with duplicated ATPase domains
MSLLNVSEVSFHYPSTLELFREVTFAIDSGDRLALVGPNGAGKSSLLKVLAGELAPTSGTIVRRRGLRIAVVAQEVEQEMCAPMESAVTLFDYVLSANSDPEDYAAESRTDRILDGLGFCAADHALSLACLSGGQRTRAALARALFAPCDLLLLDEPTNHLDIAGREWLEAELTRRDSGRACVLVSHDRTLLGRVAAGFIEIARGDARVFPGGYQEYQERRALLERQAWEEYEGAQRRKAAFERASERRAALARRVATPPPGEKGDNDFYARKAATVARTARILKERAVQAEEVRKPWAEQAIPDLDFSAVRRSGDIVLSARELGKCFGDRPLFSNLTFHLPRGARLSIAGPNGSGKTTLLRILLGREPATAGQVRWGANVQTGYFSQQPEDLSDLDGTVLEICGTSTLARTLLACLKVRPDCMARPMLELSPGERAKTELVRLLVSGANLLLLDEPTNHLEIEAQEALEQALIRFPGTVIVVSHDRSLVAALQPQVMELDRKNNRRTHACA